MSANTPIHFDDTAVAFASKSTRQLKKSFLIFYLINRPWLVRIGIALTKLALFLRLPVKGLIRNTLFAQFCGGETRESCQRTITDLHHFGIKTILDYSVEGQETEASFDRTMEEAIKVAQFAADEPGIPFCVVKVSGLGDAELMEKKQEGRTLSREETERFDRIFERLDQLAHVVTSNNLRFMIDAEESWIQGVIDEMTYRLMKKYNWQKASVYTTYQLYRKQAFSEMKKAFEMIRHEGCYFGAKLVRGAYMEKERERAEEYGYEDPIHPDKQATDKAYNQALEFAVENISYFSVCAGTHNEDSSKLLAHLMSKKLLKNDDERIYFAQLLGMSENISFALGAQGYQVAKYVPYGPIEKVVPYLFRRAEENTSVEGQSTRELTLVKKELLRRKKQKNAFK